MLQGRLGLRRCVWFLFLRYPIRFWYENCREFPIQKFLQNLGMSLSEPFTLCQMQVQMEDKMSQTELVHVLFYLQDVVKWSEGKWNEV
jgi:hypothetical protein